MVVGLDLDEDGRGGWRLETVGGRESISVGRVGREESDLVRGRLENSSVVRVGGNGALGADDLFGVSDHLKERLVLLDSVDGPGRVEDLVSAMLRVDLGEHEELDIGRIPRRVEGEVTLEEVIELGWREGKTEGDVGFDEEVHRRWLVVRLVLGGRVRKGRLGG